MSRAFRSLGPSPHREQCRLAGEWARRYAALGWNPLPSRADAKRPALGRYAQYFEQPVPREWLDDWRWPNVQLVMGSRWDLCAIDVDGSFGAQWWSDLLDDQPGHRCGMAFIAGAPNVSRHGPVVSRRLFFRWPRPDGLISIPATVLWKGEGHNEVRFLGDRSLAIVPPSVHPERKTVFEWLRFSEMGPAVVLPEWLLMKVLAARPVLAPPPVPRLDSLPRRSVELESYRTEDVLAVLGGRHVEVAVRYGLKTVGNGDPFLKCRSPEREDCRPSCSIDRRTGRFFDWTMNESCSFFDLLARLDPGTFPTWDVARDLMGAAYLGRAPRRG